MAEQLTKRVYAERITKIWQRLHEMDDTGEYANRIIEYLRGISRFDEKQRVLDQMELILNIEKYEERMIALGQFLRPMGHGLLDSAETARKYDFFESISDRLATVDLFNSPQDQQIAVDLLNKLQEKFSKKEITEKALVDGLAALDVLLPKRNEKGRRVIGGIQITPVMEKVIRSRVDSAEVDISAPEGSWGSLPEVVKEEIVSRADLLIEMTTTCTVKCSFCALAEKGPIEQKMSFDSVLAVIEYFVERERAPRKNAIYIVDALYAGSDHFDAKWREGTDRVLDYTDLALRYWNLVKDKNRALYSSTAIPLGEEMRALRFAQVLLEKSIAGEISIYNKLRISKTDANADRADAIITLLNIFFGETVVNNSGVGVSDNRNQAEAKAGRVWQREVGAISTWDVRGPNCRDGVLVRVNAVESMIMVASSNERPIGEERSPIVSTEDDGTKVYTVPHYATNPGEKILFHTPAEVYPDTIVTQIRVRGETPQITYETITENPHRAFLRIIGNLDMILFQKHQSNIDLMTPESKAQFVEDMKAEIELVQSYLAMGANNVSMRYWMKEFEDRGFFPKSD